MVKKKVGVYIGNGPPPEDVEAGMSVDMSGRDIGIMISGSSEKPEKVPTIPEILDALIEQYPEHEEIFGSYVTQYKASGNDEERNNVIASLGTWLKNHVDNVKVGIPGFVEITFK